MRSGSRYDLGKLGYLERSLEIREELVEARLPIIRNYEGKVVGEDGGSCADRRYLSSQDAYPKDEGIRKHYEFSKTVPFTGGGGSGGALYI